MSCHIQKGQQNVPPTHHLRIQKALIDDCVPMIATHFPLPSYYFFCMIPPSHCPQAKSYILSLFLVQKLQTLHLNTYFSYAFPCSLLQRRPSRDPLITVATRCLRRDDGVKTHAAHTAGLVSEVMGGPQSSPWLLKNQKSWSFLTWVIWGSLMT